MTPYGAPPGAPQAPQTLETFLAQRGPLGATELIPLLGSVLDQLGSLHTAGQHHGNLSPDTITVTPTPQGAMAAWLPPAAPLAADAWPLYQAPEQLYEGGQVGYWSDIYAVSCVLFRAVAGQAPFSGTSPDEVRQAHLQSPAPSVVSLRPELAPELDQALLMGLAKAPAERHASAQALQQAVEAAAMAAPPPAAAFAPAEAQAEAPPPTAIHPAAAPGVPGGADYASAPGAPGYAQAGYPQPGSAQPGVAPPPPVLQPAPIPQSSSGGPKVAIIAGAVGMVAVVGTLVGFLFMGSEKEKESAASSTNAEPEKKPPAEGARPVARKAAMAPVAKAPALPGVDDKIKDPLPAAGGAGPHYRVDPTGRPWRGAPDAVVVLGLYSDFQCPWCKRSRSLVDSLLKKYPKDLKVVWFDFPLRFHKQALPAAVAARSVFRQRGSAGFWRYHDKIFDNAKTISKDSLLGWAQEVGADRAVVERDLDSADKQSAVQRDMKAAQAIGVRGTPSLFVNGVKFTGRRSVDAFSTLIDAAISKARTAIKSGKSSRKDYYASLMKTGLTQKPAGAKDPGPKRPAKKRKKLDPRVIYRIPVYKDDVWKGAKIPLVTMVVWSDFECPYCKGLACTLEEVLKHRKYRRTVRLVYRHNPLSFHRNAMPAAEAVEAARALKGRKGFWRMYARVFPLNLCPRRNSKVKIRDWLSRNRDRQPKLTRASLDRFAKKLRLRMSKFRRYMDKHILRPRIEAQAAAAKKLGARGTPALFVNGRYVRGYRDFAKLSVILDQELKKARRLIKSGVKKRRLYNHITARGSRTLVYLP